MALDREKRRHRRRVGKCGPRAGRSSPPRYHEPTRQAAGGCVRDGAQERVVLSRPQPRRLDYRSRRPTRPLRHRRLCQVARHALFVVQGGTGVGGAANRCPDRGGGALGRAAGGPLGRWTTCGPDGLSPRRSGQRLPLARTARPLQPLRVAGHHLDVVPPVVVPRGRRLGRARDAKAVGRGQHPPLRRGLERTRLLARHLVGVR